MTVVGGLLRNLRAPFGSRAARRAPAPVSLPIGPAGASPEMVRLAALIPDIPGKPSRAGRPTCDWLYQNVTFDAANRVMPCCAAPTTATHLHFATVNGDSDGITNSEAFRRARLSIVDRPAYDAATATVGGPEPYRANYKFQPNVNFPVHPHAGMLLRCLDHGRVFDDPAIAALTDWTSAVVA